MGKQDGKFKNSLAGLVSKLSWCQHINQLRNKDMREIWQWQVNTKACFYNLKIPLQILGLPSDVVTYWQRCGCINEPGPIFCWLAILTNHSAPMSMVWVSLQANYDWLTWAPHSSFISRTTSDVLQRIKMSRLCPRQSSSWSSNDRDGLCSI